MSEALRRIIMIRFEEEDSDPYTHIVIYEDDEVKSGSLVAFSLRDFESWLKTRSFPQSVKEAEALLGEYEALRKKSAHEYVEKVLDEQRREEAKSYSQRYNELKNLGYSDAKIHSELFPEEYDFIYDDHVDAKLRKQGYNPMSQDYIAMVNERRVAGGFSSLDSDEHDRQSMVWVKKQGE